MSSESYIKASSEKAQKLLKEHVLFGEIQAVIKDRFVQPIDIDKVFIWQLNQVI